jgi:hypothetical protein
MGNANAFPHRETATSGVLDIFNNFINFLNPFPRRCSSRQAHARYAGTDIDVLLSRWFTAANNTGR